MEEGEWAGLDEVLGVKLGRGGPFPFERVERVEMDGGRWRFLKGEVVFWRGSDSGAAIGRPLGM